MKIAVLIKEVPDTYGERQLHLETGLADREASDKILDEVCERALEAAVKHAEGSQDVEIVVVTVGPTSATTAARKALAMGAASAVHVADDGLAGADVSLTSEALAAAVKRVKPDLIMTGNLSTDGGGGVIPASLAERLGLPLLSYLDSVEIGDGVVKGVRAVDGARQSVEAPLPAIVSITEQMPEARLPNLRGIMAANKKPYETLSLADLEVDAAALAPRSIMTAVSRRPPRTAGVKVVDEGDAAQQLADFLAKNGLI